MATVHVAFHSPMDGAAPVAGAIPSGSEVISSTGTSQATTIAAGNNSAVTITADGPVWVAFGSSPVAAEGTDWLILAGQTRDFGRIAPGSKVAVIDA